MGLSFFPGDGLLFTVGVIAAKGLLNVWLVISIFVLASIGGYYFNYWLEKNLGHRLFASPKFKLLNEKHFIQTHQFYQKHGAKTILFGRFIPYIRTFLPFLAGMALMDKSLFHRFNIIGGLFWSFSITLVGYYLGQIPFIETHFMWIVAVMIIASWIPFIYTGLKWVFNKLIKKSNTFTK